MATERGRCELCGEPMPDGEEMFKFHGYSGPCPKPPLPKPEAQPEPPTPEPLTLRTKIGRLLADEAARRLKQADEERNNPYERHAHLAARHALQIASDEIDAIFTATPEPERKATCATHGHLFNREHACIFCGANDPCAPYLKEGETHAECIARNRADIDSLLALLAREKDARAAVEAAHRQEIERLTQERDAVVRLNEHDTARIVQLEAERDALRKSLDAYEEGLAAFVRGQQRDTNPYPSGDSWHVPPEHQMWDDGFDAAQPRALNAQLKDAEAEAKRRTAERDALAAHVATLREVLQRLADCDWTIGRGDRMDPVRDIARAALAATEGGTK